MLTIKIAAGNSVSVEQFLGVAAGRGGLVTVNAQHHTADGQEARDAGAAVHSAPHQAQESLLTPGEGFRVCLGAGAEELGVLHAASRRPHPFSMQNPKLLSPCTQFHSLEAGQASLDCKRLPPFTEPLQ